ncbi:hypothetical protein BU16DRAFT_604146 [Lophium mytilinum]|uniref:F-box domain-containing protein n=1 Tax=Lophium mytilinum TaxID=390894 RepID=A0A6A6R629_9PEZI|nr:hypothetical protein BU16DRAFT_604146 [Lophium mytilinum]
MSFPRMPNELVLETALYLDDRSLYRLSQTCWRYQNLLHGEFHARAIVDRPASGERAEDTATIPAIEWAVNKDNFLLVRYLLTQCETWPNDRGATREVLQRISDGDYFEIETITEIVAKVADKGIVQLRGRKDYATIILHELLARKDQEKRYATTDYPAKRLKLIETLLFKHRADPNELEVQRNSHFSWYSHDRTSRSWLHQTIDQPEVFKLLARHGADQISTSRHERDILCTLLLRHDEKAELVRALLKAGAKPNQAIPEDEPLWETVKGPWLRVAITRQHYKTAMALVEFGASLQLCTIKNDAGEESQYLPLHHVVSLCKPGEPLQVQMDLISLFFRHRANPNAFTLTCKKGSDTKVHALDIAVKERVDEESLEGQDIADRAKILNLLLAHGADPTAKDLKGRDFLQRCKSNHVEGDRLGFALQVVMKVALDHGRTDLLPAEFVLENTKTTVLRFQEILKKKTQLDPAIVYIRQALADNWKMLLWILNTVKFQEFPIAREVYRFMHENQVEVAVLLNILPY